MLSLEHWTSFAFATLVFACMPGPAILYMTAQTLAHGRRAGLMAALGVHLGCYVHIAAAAIGLAALLDQAPAVYAIMKLAGAAYLVWLGVTMLLGRHQSSSETADRKPAVLRDSMVVEILNPKTALFFLTFLPQFVDPTAAIPIWMQFLGLGTVVNIIFSAADVAAVGLASLTLGRFADGSLGRLMPRTCGSILIVLGVTLVQRHG
ncbi:LysE family translocator [Agrobacterium rhizogenes]|uniref:LysE family translocator n=1 Tax=Rhizobium rhizogenes TaxID=359 RepID=UPI00157174F7|nr:LysE family translocator [Rhizobium rhizogenes]NTG51345.1 LysE family translocator [Rhizobium rhizogenes]